MCKNNNKSFWGVKLRSKSFVTYDNRQVVDLGEFRILWIVVFLAAGNALLREAFNRAFAGGTFNGFRSPPKQRGKQSTTRLRAMQSIGKV